MVSHHLGRRAALGQQLERLTGFAAARVVVDRDGHGQPSGLAADAQAACRRLGSAARLLQFANSRENEDRDTKRGRPDGYGRLTKQESFLVGYSARELPLINCIHELNSTMRRGARIASTRPDRPMSVCFSCAAGTLIFPALGATTVRYLGACEIPARIIIRNLVHGQSDVVLAILENLSIVVRDLVQALKFKAVC